MAEVNQMIDSLWAYWSEPSPKARLHRVDEEEVRNSEAISFSIKFTILAMAIFFIGEFLRCFL